jgi:hypothetical protein
VAHILDNRIAVDVDNDHRTGWPGGLSKLAAVTLDQAQTIGVAFFDPHLVDAQAQRIVTQATLDEWKLKGRIAGLRFGPNWYGWPEPSWCAKIFSDEITRLEANPDGTTTRRVDVCEYDVEPPHNTAEETAYYRDWQIKFLLGYARSDGSFAKGIRGAGGYYPDSRDPRTLGYRWGRPFVYTVEGRQTLAQIPADVVVRAGGKFAPQPYNGAMTEVWDDMREFQTWVRTGIVLPGFFTLFGDAAQAHRPLGMRERILFATSRLTELYT